MIETTSAGRSDNVIRQEGQSTTSRRTDETDNQSRREDTRIERDSERTDEDTAQCDETTDVSDDEVDDATSPRDEAESDTDSDTEENNTGEEEGNDESSEVDGEGTDTGEAVSQSGEPTETTTLADAVLTTETSATGIPGDVVAEQDTVNQEPATSITGQNVELASAREQVVTGNAETTESADLVDGSTGKEAQTVTSETPEISDKAYEGGMSTKDTTVGEGQNVESQPTSVAEKTADVTQLKGDIEEDGWELDELIDVNESRISATKTGGSETEEDIFSNNTDTGQMKTIEVPKEAQIDFSMNSESGTRGDTETGAFKSETQDTFETLISESSERPTVGNTRSQETAQSSTSSERTFEMERAVASQVIRGTLTMVKEGKNELRLQLRPPELGEVKISLTMENNVMTGRIVVSSENVRNMVERQLQQLKNAMADGGVKVDTLEVQVGNQGKQTFGGDSGSQTNARTATGEYARSTSTNDEGSTYTWDMNSIRSENSRVHLIV